MREDTITSLPDPNGFSADPLTDLIGKGARQLIEQALEAELVALLAQFSNETTPEGHARIVRHGHLPEREVMTGIGPVAVKVPRVRDRGKRTEKVRLRLAALLFQRTSRFARRCAPSPRRRPIKMPVDEEKRSRCCSPT